MTDADNRTFIKAYLDNWRKTPPDLHDVFHPEGRLLPPGRREPLDVDGAQQLVEGTRVAIPDVALRIINWAEREGQMFIEWEMTGTVGGKQVRWSGINRNTLRGAKSVDAVSFWDRQGLAEQINPDAPRVDVARLIREQSR